MLVNFLPNINCVNHLPLFPCDIQHIRLRNYICLKYKIFSGTSEQFFFLYQNALKKLSNVLIVFIKAKKVALWNVLLTLVQRNV